MKTINWQSTKWAHTPFYLLLLPHYTALWRQLPGKLSGIYRPVKQSVALSFYSKNVSFTSGILLTKWFSTLSCQSTQDHICGCSHYSKCSQDIRPRWWLTHTRGEDSRGIAVAAGKPLPPRAAGPKPGTWKGNFTSSNFHLCSSSERCCAFRALWGNSSIQTSHFLSREETFYSCEEAAEKSSVVSNMQTNNTAELCVDRSQLASATQRKYLPFL